MTSFSFWYPFWNQFQPGVFWPEVAPYSLIMVFSVIALLTYMSKQREYQLSVAFKAGAFTWAIAYLVIRSVSLISNGVSLAFAEFIVFLPVYVFLTVSILLIKSPQDFNRFAWGSMLGGSFIVVYGIYACLTGLRAGEHGGLAGAYGNYENHNDYTFVVLQTMPYLYLARNTRNGFVKNLVLSILFAACFYGVFLSQSRGGMLALVLQTILIVLFTMSRKMKLFVLPLVIILGIGGISLQYARRAVTSGANYTQEDAESSRMELWKAGINMFEHHPILGVGSRLFPDYARQYGELSKDQFGKNSHNTYIEILASLGFVGLFCFVFGLIRVHKELKIKLPDSEAFPVDWIRLATLISFYTIIFRAFLDAKDRDLSWVLFAVMATACHAHRYKFGKGMAVLPSSLK